MAKCDLTLHLDGEKTSFRPGDIVRGTLEVRVDKDAKCNELKVGLRWRTHGKGNSVSEEIASQVLFQGDWTAGATWTGRFELRIPSAGPFTYNGHYLNVAWEVFARADIPWAIDPKTEIEILLEPDPEADPDWIAAAGSSHHVPKDFKEKVLGPESTVKPSGGCAGNALGIGCLLLLFGPMVFFLGAGITRGAAWARGDLSLGEALPWMFGAVAVLAVFIFATFKVIRNVIAKKKLGRVDFQIEPRLVRAGQDLSVRIGCKPEGSTELLGATARIVATETVVRGTGTNKSTYRQVVYEKDFEISGAKSLAAGLPYQDGVSIPIPADAPPSFYASDNKLTWNVEARLDIARWPDWVDHEEILVHR